MQKWIVAALVAILITGTLYGGKASAADLMVIESISITSANIRDQPTVTITGQNLPNLRYQNAITRGGNAYHNLYINMNNASNTNILTWGCPTCYWGFDNVVLSADATQLSFRLRATSGNQYWDLIPSVVYWNIYLTDYNGSLIGGGGYTDRVNITFNKDTPGNATIAYDPVRPDPDMTPPAVPTGLVGTPTDGQVLLNWTANADADLVGYNLYRDGVKVNTTPLIGTSYTDTGLTNGVAYTYRLSAVDTSGNESGQSDPLTITPIDTIPPAAPQGISGTPADGQILLNWTANADTDLAGYNLYRDGVKINDTPLIGTSYTDTGLTNGVAYTYQISALDISGNESPRSDPISIAPSDGLIQPPQDLKIKQSDNGIDLTWTAPVPPPDKYYIYRDNVLIMETTTPNYTDAGSDLEYGSGYKYRVTSVVDDVESAGAEGKIYYSDKVVDFDPDGGFMHNIMDVIQTGFNFAKQYSTYILVVLGVIFAPTIISFVIWMMRGFPRHDKNKKNKKRSDQERDRIKRILFKDPVNYLDVSPNDQGKLEERTYTRTPAQQAAVTRKLNKARDDKYEYLTRTGRIKERDEWALKTEYKNREQRQAFAREERNRKAREQRAAANPGRQQRQGRGQRRGR